MRREISTEWSLFTDKLLFKLVEKINTTQRVRQRNQPTSYFKAKLAHSYTHLCIITMTQSDMMYNNGRVKSPQLYWANLCASALCFLSGRQSCQSGRHSHFRMPIGQRGSAERLNRKGEITAWLSSVETDPTDDGSTF